MRALVSGCWGLIQIKGVRAFICQNCTSCEITLPVNPSSRPQPIQLEKRYDEDFVGVHAVGYLSRNGRR